jgi:hypothetical protein
LADVCREEYRRAVADRDKYAPEPERDIDADYLRAPSAGGFWRGWLLGERSRISQSVPEEEKRESIETQDFEQFCRDLMDIAGGAGRRSFVMFYDEANRVFCDEASPVRKKISAALLESIAEALTDSGLVGGYVASPAMVGEFRRLAIFGKELQLGPFDKFRDMQRLLAR